MSDITLDEKISGNLSMDFIEKEVYDLPLENEAKIQVVLIRTEIKQENDSLPIKYIIHLTLELLNSSDDIKLHWAVYTKKNASLWLHPKEKFYPKNTVDSDKNSVDTSFEKNQILFEFEIKNNDEDFFQGINFVLKNNSNGDLLYN